MARQNMGVAELDLAEVAPDAAYAFADIPGPVVTDAASYNARNHQYLLEMHEQYGDIFALDVSSMARDDPASGAPSKRVAFVRDPIMARTVLQSEDFGKTWDSGSAGTGAVDYVHNLVQPMLGNTVFNQQGEGGPHQGRFILKPMLNAVKDLSAGFARQIDLALDRWQEGRMDALGLCHDLMRQSLLAAIVGRAASTANAQTEDTFHELLDYFIDRCQEPEHTATVSAEDEAMMGKAKDAGMRIVQAWRKAGWAQQAQDYPEEGKTMLAVMDKAGNSDEEMASTLVNAIIAGAEAPGSTLAQLLQEVAFNAPLQQALAQEVASKAKGGEVLEVNAQLKYTEACVMEGLRYFAPATLVQRVAIAPTTLGGYDIPSGTVVGVCVTAMHRDANNFANPWAFDPLGRGKLNVHMLTDRNCFMAFSGGRRGCPGKHLGIMMLRLALAKIVQRFELTASRRRGRDHLHAAGQDDGHGIPKFVEWQAGGIPLELNKRPAAKL